MFLRGKRKKNEKFPPQSSPNLPQSRITPIKARRTAATMVTASTERRNGVVCVFQQHPNATNSSETSVGGVSGACGSSGIPAPGEAGCSSRGGSSSGAGGGGTGAGQGCEQARGGPSSHSTHSHAKFRHGLLQLMIHTIDPLHDGQSRAGIPTPHSITLACSLWLLCLARL